MKKTSFAIISIKSLGCKGLIYSSVNNPGEIVFKCEDVMKRAVDRTSSSSGKADGADPAESDLAKEPPALLLRP